MSTLGGAGAGAAAPGAQRPHSPHHAIAAQTLRPPVHPAARAETRESAGWARGGLHVLESALSVVFLTWP